MGHVVNYSSLIEQINTLLDIQAAADRFSGAVLVAQGDQVLVETARGFAIHPNLVPNQPDTRFNIASVTKMLTAVAVMQLVASGKLDLHTPIAAYNPELPHSEQVTIHHLLTHTAGFGRYWNDAYRAARSDLRTVSDYLKLFADTPLEFPPGTRHLYGNVGYVILGAVIEAVTGVSYYDHMRQSIYLPAGMHDTDHDELDLPAANRAMGYTKDNWFGPVDGLRRSNDFIYAIKGSPSEHCYSTVHDLSLFFQALQNQSLLDADYMALCIAPHAAGEQPGVSYGYGFHLIDDGVHGRVVGHGGRALGGDAFSLMYRDLGFTVIVLSNYDRPAARGIVNEIANLLLSWPQPYAPLTNSDPV
jgi:CubicO group peptidase (beta-lactamase class C family)